MAAGLRRPPVLPGGGCHGPPGTRREPPPGEGGAEDPVAMHPVSVQGKLRNVETGLPVGSLCSSAVRLSASTQEAVAGSAGGLAGVGLREGPAGAREIMPAALFAKGKSSHGSEFAGSTASPRNDRGAPMRGVASGGGSRSTPDPSLDAELASRMSSVRRCLILKSDQEIPCCGHRLSLTMS